MALPSFATIPDLENWVDEDIADDDGRALFLLETASVLIRAYTKKTWVDESSALLVSLPDALKTVAVLVAGRAWQNPKGMVQETVGPFSGTYPTGGGTNAGLFLSKTEKDMLDDPAVTGNNTPGMWVLSTTRGDSVDGTYRMPVDDGSQPIPWTDSDEFPNP